MSAKHRVEVFTSGCPLCDETVKLVKDLTCPDCEVVVYDLHTGCETNECRDKALGYGIKSVPAVAVDGQLLNCCGRSGVDPDVLKAAIA